MSVHQAAAEETLMGVTVERTGHRTLGSPGKCRGSFRCVAALATVMVALLVGFMCTVFVFTPSRNQDAVLQNCTSKLSREYRLQAERSDEGEYDVFTVDKSATYLIYGWLRFAEVPAKDVTVRQMFKGDHRDMRTRRDNTTVFFFEEIKMVTGSRLSIRSHSPFKDGLFHVYEL